MLLLPLLCSFVLLCAFNLHARRARATQAALAVASRCCCCFCSCCNCLCLSCCYSWRAAALALCCAWAPSRSVSFAYFKLLFIIIMLPSALHLRLVFVTKLMASLIYYHNNHFLDVLGMRYCAQLPPLYPSTALRLLTMIIFFAFSFARFAARFAFIYLSRSNLSRCSGCDLRECVCV